MTWQAAIADLNTAVLDLEHGFGESFLLADGGQIQAIFTLNNPAGWGAGADLVDALDAAPQPSLQLATAQAISHDSQLGIGAAITRMATADRYIIAEDPEHDGHGLTRLALTPAQAQDSDPDAEDQRWR